MIICQIFEFNAAHMIPSVETDEPEGRLHGHTYRLEILLDGPVGDNGTVMDRPELKRRINSVLDMLDRSYLNDFLDCPTAENLVRYIWGEINPLLDGLAALRLWEGSSSYAQYSYTDSQIDEDEEESKQVEN